MAETRFVILFSGRSGSTYLTSLLASHPQIECRMEDFLTNPWKTNGSQRTRSGTYWADSDRSLKTYRGKIEQPSRQQVLDHLDEVYSRPVSAAGFKYKYPGHVQRFPEVMQRLVELKDQLRVIHLHRNNLLKQAVSMEVLEARRKRGDQIRGGNLIGESEYQPVRVDVSRVLFLANRQEKLRQNAQRRIQRFSNLLEIDYESLLASRGETIARVLTFLNVDPHAELQTEYLKSTPDDLRSALENFDELSSAVAGSNLEPMLHG